MFIFSNGKFREIHKIQVNFEYHYFVIISGGIRVCVVIIKILIKRSTDILLIVLIFKLFY